MGVAIRIGATSSDHVVRSCGPRPERTSRTAPTIRRRSGSLPITRVPGTVRRGEGEQPDAAQLEELARVQQVVRGPGGGEVAGRDRAEGGLMLATPVGGGEAREPGQGLLPLGEEGVQGCPELAVVVAARGDPGHGVDGRPGLLRPVQDEVEARAEILTLLVEEMRDDL